ncbi:hypothetical protein V5799_017440 [Amblyomma americanum]|uniref:Uncharacterized protein n=1 Tax=Amblyomma americanum TaxID=6943 RepID=A0AAQ4F254_AMBAM
MKRPPLSGQLPSRGWMADKAAVIYGQAAAIARRDRTLGAEEGIEIEQCGRPVGATRSGALSATTPGCPSWKPKRWPNRR